MGLYFGRQNQTSGGFAFWGDLKFRVGLLGPLPPRPEGPLPHRRGPIHTMADPPPMSWRPPPDRVIVCRCLLRTPKCIGLPAPWADSLGTPQTTEPFLSGTNWEQFWSPKPDWSLRSGLFLRIFRPQVFLKLSYNFFCENLQKLPSFAYFDFTLDAHSSRLRFHCPSPQLDSGACAYVTCAFACPEVRAQPAKSSHRK